MDSCPHCGADLPDGAEVCRECGSDGTTGWSEQARNDSLGLPDENFDYADFVKREFGEEKIKRRGLRWFWWVVAVLLLLVFLIACIR